MKSKRDNVQVDRNHRLTFDPRIAFWLCMVASTAMVPFAAVHVWHGRVFMAAVTSTVMLTAAIIGWAIRRLGKVPYGVLVVTSIIGCSMVALAAHHNGANSFLWAYPLTVFNFFLLGARGGAIINGVACAVLVTDMLRWAESAFSARAVATLLLLNLFAWVFSFYIGQQRNALAKLARTDSLTDTGNRRALDESLEEALAHHQRYGGHVSLIMLDLDHFKRINDDLGHRTGDDVLRSLALLIRQTVRRSDKLFRYGGEEFVLLLPETAQAQACEAADKLRRAVKAEDLVPGRNLTVSAGVAEYASLETADDWLKRGDEALYKAKAQGRNCVIAAD